MYVTLHSSSTGSNDSSPHARKSLTRKQKREQRERQLEERWLAKEFKLERRKPPSERHHRGPEHYPQHSLPPSVDSRLPVPPHSNPQFAKWIMEQNPLYYSEMGSEVDLESSMSSLANMPPERDHPINTEMGGYFESTTPRYNYNGYRPNTPPQRDSSPSKMSEQPFAKNFGSSAAVNSRIPSKTHDIFNNHLNKENRTLPVSKPHLPSTAGPYKDEFASLASQMTMDSQQTFSQQHPPHLDKLSMDVMHHTQLSGTSFQGITSLIPKHKHHSTAGEAQLDKRGLKKLEAEFKMDMDDIDLEKQRIQFMFHEQQKQKELAEITKALNAKALPPSDDESDDIGDDHDEPLPREHLRQELESLDGMVSAQRKKYREIKFSREREELKLKEIEMKFREQEMSIGGYVFNSGDQKRWQSDQKRLFRELDRLKTEQNEIIQKVQNSERRAKTKLKAYETQASELRQQLNITTPPTASPSMALKNGYETYDTVPSKLTSEFKKRPNSAKAYQDTEMKAPPSDMKWLEPSRGFSHVPTMSIDESIFETPDLAREPMNTISASCLTEPTQDEPSRWSGFNPAARDLYTVDSRTTINTDDSFNRREGEMSRTFRAMSMDHLEGSQSVPSREVVPTEGRKDRLPIRRGASIATPIQPEKRESSSPTKMHSIPEISAQPTYDVPTRHQQTSFIQAQPTTTTQQGRHHPRHARSRGVQYTKVFIQQNNSESNNKTTKRTLIGSEDAPDVVPTPSHILPRPGERNQSPGSHSSLLVPSPQPADPYYAVPTPAHITTSTHAPSSTSPLATTRQPHITTATARPPTEGGTNGNNSPTIYDQPKSSRPNSATVYDVPTAARKQRVSPSPYETHLLEHRGNVPKPKPNSGHRYGIIKPHSYSRTRPDPNPQLPVSLDNVKSYMDRAYKNPGQRHQPERVQRQQTEL